MARLLVSGFKCSPYSVMTMWWRAAIHRYHVLRICDETVRDGATTEFGVAPALCSPSDRQCAGCLVALRKGGGYRTTHVTCIVRCIIGSLRPFFRHSVRFSSLGRGIGWIVDRVPDNGRADSQNVRMWISEMAWPITDCGCRSEQYFQIPCAR